MHFKVKIEEPFESGLKTLKCPLISLQVKFLKNTFKICISLQAHNKFNKTHFFFFNEQ